MRARRVRKVLSAIAAMALSGNAMAAVFTAPYGPGGTYNLYQPVFVGLQQKDAIAASQILDPLGNGLIGHLVTLHSVAENNFVHSIAGGGDVWIGLTDRVGGAPGAFEAGSSPTNGWAWVTGEAFTFQNWGGGEPNDFNGIEDAAHIRGDALWNDHSTGWAANQPVADPSNADESGGPFLKYVIEWETNSATPVAGAQLGGMPKQGTLPGPMGGVMTWGVREVIGNGQLDVLQQAIDSIASGGGVIRNGFAPTINHSDAETNGTASGSFPGDQAFLTNTGGVDDNDFAVLYRGTIRITNPGDHTFWMRSDDGFGMRIVGATFTGIAGTGNAQIDPLDSSVVTHTAVTGDANTRMVANLAAGDYNVEVIMFERAGGAFVELSAAEGNFLVGGEANFRPIGHKAGDPTYKPGIAGDNWTVTASPPGGAAINNFNGLLADLTAGPNTVVLGVDTINYTDPQTNGGDPGSPFGAHKPFPTDTGADDNDFGIFATATLVIPFDGAYEFGFRGDDGGFIRIVGQPWDSVLVNGTGATVIANIFGTGNDTLWCDCLTGDSNSLGKIFLNAGVYTIETGMFERGGGAWFEVFARGNGNMALLGGPAMLMPDFDGIQLVPLPAAAWMGLALMGGLATRRSRKA